MRILQVIPTITTGGAERMLANLTRHLRAAGHTVGVVSLWDPDGMSVEEELRAQGVDLYLLGKRGGFDARMIPRFARTMSRFAPDVLHTHLYVLKYVLPAVMLRRRRVVHTVHNLADREGGRGDVIVQQVAFRMGVVPVAIGDEIAKSIQRLYRVPARRTIPNGIPVADYAPPPGAREEFRESVGIPAEAPVFVTVGRFFEQKNHVALIAAFASERLRSMGSHLLLAGDGELRGELEGLVRQRGVAGRVHFLGKRGDVPRVLAAADVFVLPSLWEGHPLSVMEAMAAGKPVIATTVGSVPELVTPGTGLLVRPGDVAALEAAMFEIASDPGRARAAGAEALLAARARFDASVMARAYDDLYHEVAR